MFLLYSHTSALIGDYALLFGRARLVSSEQLFHWFISSFCIICLPPPPSRAAAEAAGTLSVILNRLCSVFVSAHLLENSPFKIYELQTQCSKPKLYNFEDCISFSFLHYNLSLLIQI